AHCERESGEQCLVAVQEQLATVLAGHRGAGGARGGVHDETYGEGIGERVGTPVRGLRETRPAVLVAGERARVALREQRLERGGADRGEQALERCGVFPRPVAVRGGDRDEVP